MKTKLLAMALLAGGSMFAQTRVSVGIGFGGNNAGYYQAAPAYVDNYNDYQYMRRDDDRDDRRVSEHGYQAERSRRVERDANYRDRDRDQSRR